MAIECNRIVLSKARIAYATEAGRIPEELLTNKSVAASLPILFRTLRGQKISEKKLEKLVELIKKA